MSDIDPPYADPSVSGVTPADYEALQGPLDHEALAAAHFPGYDLEPLITVGLNPVELVTPPVRQSGKGGGP